MANIETEPSLDGVAYVCRICLKGYSIDHKVVGGPYENLHEPDVLLGVCLDCNGNNQRVSE